jgi:choline dehydrogenase-like flavoprotein
VADAAVVPGPLAVNPTLTIVGFAKKIAAQIPAAAAAGAGH